MEGALRQPILDFSAIKVLVNKSNNISGLINSLTNNLVNINRSNVSELVNLNSLLPENEDVVTTMSNTTAIPAGKLVNVLCNVNLDSTTKSIPKLFETEEIMDWVTGRFRNSQHSSVIRQKGESLSGVSRKQRTSNFPKNEHTWAYQGVRNFRFSENLAYFVLLKHPFWDSPFCLTTDAIWVTFIFLVGVENVSSFNCITVLPLLILLIKLVLLWIIPWVHVLVVWNSLVH